MDKKWINNDWNNFFTTEFEKEYFKQLSKFVENEYNTKVIYPPRGNVFNAFRYTQLQDIKVVILGQDPYHQKGQAHGLAFSTPNGNAIPRSLINIYKEIDDEYKCGMPQSGCLIKWAKQGVFLLNTVLTVEDSTPNSHANQGWEIFTDNVIKEIDKQEQPIVFLLWGNSAKQKKELLTNKNHLVLTTVHPSPLSASRGFFGCGHFKKANEFLRNNNIDEIDWKI